MQTTILTSGSSRCVPRRQESDNVATAWHRLQRFRQPSREAANDPHPFELARDVLSTTGMTRFHVDRAARIRSQRKLLAVGSRIRGQWRYLARSTKDPLLRPANAADPAIRAGAARRSEPGSPPR
jgi:hypothetical protein